MSGLHMIVYQDDSNEFVSDSNDIKDKKSVKEIHIYDGLGTV